MFSLQSGVQQMNDNNHRSRSNSAWGWKFGAVLSLILWTSSVPAWAQGPRETLPTYANSPQYHSEGGVLPAQFPSRPQYYEYLPPGRGWDEYTETPLDRFLRQAARQAYGRVDYLHWNISNPGAGVIGGPGKKLLDGEGFTSPSYIDPVRGPDALGWPITNPLLKHHPNSLVLIQAWETNPDQLLDESGDGNIFDPGDDNDLDVFPRITNVAKSNMLLGLDFGILFSSGDPTATPLDPAQVAVLAVGQLANTSAFKQDNNNGFRGLVGMKTSFGAIEANMFVMDRSRSDFQFQAIPAGFIGVPGGGPFRPADPLVIPTLVNGQMAPNVLDSNGNIVTDSNNYYIIFNEAYSAQFQSDAWGATPQVLFTMYERPDRFKISSVFGFKYFDFREQMLQRGSFTNDPARATFVYENEVAEDFSSTINSTTINRVYGPQAGLRAELGGERVTFGLDTNLMLGANTHEAAVGVDSLLFPGDNNFTRQSSTHFATGFDMLVDARIRMTEHVTLSVGYNVMWFNAITRPHDNIHYNINAIPVDDPGGEGPDWNVSNDVRVDKKNTNVHLTGWSVGLLINW